MNIFSKWFGSKKEEQNDEIVEGIVSFKDPEPAEIFPAPQNLPEAFRYVVNKWGADYLNERSLLNILNDFQVFKDIPAAKHILINMQANGYIEKIIQSTNWCLDSKNLAAKYSNVFGAKEEIVAYLVQSIGYGLKFSSKIPQYSEKEEAPQPQFTDCQIQPKNFPPQQNNQQPANIPPPIPSPTPVPIRPYNPKDDLPNYQYPTLDLLEDYVSEPEIISLKSVFESNEFQNTTMELPCAVGKKENGEILMFDLAEAPHLMVSGASGMGVSVFFNTIITSLLYKKHPAEMKLVLIDPKKIEFSLYNPLRYYFLAGLLNYNPVVTDMGRMSEVILSLLRLMENRLELFKDAGVRNIKDYNRKFCLRKLNPSQRHHYMPYIVVIIDEYDVISTDYGKVIGAPLENISRMGRSVGIHLIISVQRPVGTVISSGIKANISSRVAFRVTSVNESRNILGIGGAEKLQRPGEMIYTNGIILENSKCAFMDTEEIDRVNDFIGNQQGYNMVYGLPPYIVEDNTTKNHVDMAHLDPLFEEAARLVVDSQSGSTSLVQRKFAIGYNRACGLMNQLEKAGVVGAAIGSKPREVLIHDEYSLNKFLASLGKWN